MSVTVRDNTVKAKRKISAAVQRSLKLVASDLQGKAAQLAPVDTGDLRGSITTDDSEVARGRVRVGSSLPYALKQHEDLTLNHPQGGEAKYLEKPALENQRAYQRMVGAALKIEIDNA